MNKKLLIIGCPRSGFGYTAALCRELGLEICHERLEEHGMVSWLATFEDDDLPSYHPPVKHSDFIVLHQVRHPLDTIASLQTLGYASWKRLMSHMPESVDTVRLLKSENKLHRAMHVWHYWNVAAERSSLLTYRVEALNAGSLSSSVSTRTNSRPHEPIGWPDLAVADNQLCRSIALQAGSYGYKL